MSEYLYRVSASLEHLGARRQPYVVLRENSRRVSRTPVGAFAPMARRGSIASMGVSRKTLALLVKIGYLRDLGPYGFSSRHTYEPTVAGIIWAYCLLLEARGRAGGANLLRHASFEDLVGRDLPIIDEFFRKANLLDGHGGPTRVLRAYMDEVATSEGIQPEHLTRDGVRLTITAPAISGSILVPWSIIEALVNAEPDTDLRDIVSDVDMRWMLLHYGYLSHRAEDGEAARFVTPGGRMRAAWLLWRRDAKA